MSLRYMVILTGSSHRGVREGATAPETGSGRPAPFRTRWLPSPSTIVSKVWPRRSLIALTVVNTTVEQSAP